MNTNYYTNMGKVMVLILGCVLITAASSGALAETLPATEDFSFADDEFADDAFVESEESEITGTLYEYNPAVREKDPFLPILEMEKKKRPVTATIRTVTPQPDVEITPPFKMEVLCIVGNIGDRLALIEFEGELLEVSATFEAEGQFKVVAIGSDAVEVYSYSHRCRKTVKLQ